MQCLYQFTKPESGQRVGIYINKTYGEYCFYASGQYSKVIVDERIKDHDCALTFTLANDGSYVTLVKEEGINTVTLEYLE